MARLFFMAFDSAGQMNLVKKLRASGHRLAIAQPRYPEFYELLKQQSPAPEAIIVDCSHLASHARESSNYIRGLKTYKETPLILYNVRKEDELRTRERVPNAIILPNDQVEKQLAALGFLPTPPPS